MKTPALTSTATGAAGGQAGDCQTPGRLLTDLRTETLSLQRESWFVSDRRRRHQITPVPTRRRTGRRYVACVVCHTGCGPSSAVLAPLSRRESAGLLTCSPDPSPSCRDPFPTRRGRCLLRQLLQPRAVPVAGQPREAQQLRNAVQPRQPRAGRPREGRGCTVGRQRDWRSLQTDVVDDMKKARGDRGVRAIPDGQRGWRVLQAAGSWGTARPPGLADAGAESRAARCKQLPRRPLAFQQTLGGLPNVATPLQPACSSPGYLCPTPISTLLWPPANAPLPIRTLSHATSHTLHRCVSPPPLQLVHGPVAHHDLGVREEGQHWWAARWQQGEGAGVGRGGQGWAGQGRD